jgi:ribosomal protein L13
MLDKRPEMVLELGVKGMLPKTKLGRAMIKKLFLYKELLIRMLHKNQNHLNFNKYGNDK